MEAVEFDAVGGDPVQVGRTHLGAVVSHVSPPEIVRHDDDDVRTPAAAGRRGAGESNPAGGPGKCRVKQKRPSRCVNRRGPPFRVAFSGPPISVWFTCCLQRPASAIVRIKFRRRVNCSLGVLARLPENHETQCSVERHKFPGTPVSKQLKSALTTNRSWYFIMC